MRFFYMGRRGWPLLCRFCSVANGGKDLPLYEQDTTNTTNSLPSAKHWDAKPLYYRRQSITARVA